MSHQAPTTALFALASILLLTFYGAEVCPYMDGLGALELLPVFALAFAVALGLRTLAIGQLMRRARVGVLDTSWPWRTLQLNLATWVAAGLFVTLWNLVVHDFPVGSGVKAVLGCATIGVFAASYLGLTCERTLIERSAQRAVDERLEAGRFLSVTTKFMLFAALSMGLIVVVVLLVLTKDFRELQGLVDELSRAELSAAYPAMYRAVFVEIGFVFATLLVGSSLVGWRYTRNVLLVFDQQLEVFEQVSEGCYELDVPVVSHDEFSLIAHHTNGMIDGLRERDRMQSALGKIVSPAVADCLLCDDGGLRLGGEEVDVAILFTDIRGWTPLSERLEPQALVALLNDYFTLVVKAVHGHRGVLDKFIGDAAMAVFGLDDSPNRCDDAVQTAIQIKRDMRGFNARLRARGLPEVMTGIGIDYGPVIAGNIGSRDRLEFTVIGDSVNTAARLESLTKELATTVALSSNVHERCAQETRAQTTWLGHFKLKGKADRQAVHGADPTAWGGAPLDSPPLRSS